MFKQRSNPKTDVKIIFDMPTVYIKPTAYAKMAHLVDLVDKEVGWLGTAYKTENNGVIVIEDVILFHQEVNSTTCEITPEGLSEFAEELLQLESGLEKWNNIKLWGHSHVNMGVSPSTQDDKQMEVFADHNEWFLRIIANKSGELKVDLFDYKANISYLDLPWEIFLPELFDTREFIQEEIKEKVKEKSYTIYTKKKEKEKEEKETYKNYIDLYSNEVDDDYGDLYSNEVLDDYGDLYGFLTQNEIIEIASAETFKKAKEILEEILGKGYSDYELEDLYYNCIAFCNDLDYYQYYRGVR